MYSLTEAIINNAVIHILIPVHWARVLLGMRAWLGHSLQSCVRAAMLTALLVLKHLESLHLPSLRHSSHHRISEILHLKQHSHVFLHSFIQVIYWASIMHKQTKTDLCCCFFPTLPNPMGDSHNSNSASIYWMCNLRSLLGTLVEDMQTITIQWDACKYWACTLVIKGTGRRKA